jgi:hypothetical protein
VRGINAPRIELTEFGDKRNLCKALLDGNRSEFDKDLNCLRELRDQIAPASTFVDGSDGKTGVAAFVEKFESATRWIDKLQSWMSSLGQENANDPPGPHQTSTQNSLYKYSSEH